MLRNDPTQYDEDEENSKEEIYFDVCILNDVDNDEDNEMWVMLLNLETEGGFDDEGCFVVESFCIINGDDEELHMASERINQLFSMTICSCSEHFIKDGGDMCIFCEMSCSHADLEKTFCVICQSETARKNTILKSCCQNRIHTRCLHTWHTTSGKTQCPHCRKDI